MSNTGSYLVEYLAVSRITRPTAQSYDISSVHYSVYLAAGSAVNSTLLFMKKITQMLLFKNPS